MLLGGGLATSRRKLTVVLVLSAAAVLALAVVAASGSSKQPRAASKQTQQIRIRPATAPRAVDPEVKAAFAVFRRARTTDDAVAMGHSSGMMVAEHGIALDLARRVPTAAGGPRAWVVPSAEGLCTLVRTPNSIGPGGGCGTGDEVFTKGAVLIVGDRNGDTEVIGLVPDGVDEVQLHFADGGSRSLQVRDNGYFAKVSRPTKNVTFAGASRAVSVIAESP
jgi:hypothetical protein